MNTTPKSLGRAIADGDIPAMEHAIAQDRPSQGRLNRAIVRQACGLDESGRQELPPLPKNVRLEVVRCLLNAGAEVDNEDAGSFLTVMHVAVRDNDLGLMDLALEFGSRIHLPHAARMGELPPFPFAALHKASRQVFERLVEAGADPNQTDSLGHNAAAFAVGANDLRLLDDLLDLGVDVNHQDNYGRTPLLQHFTSLESGLLLDLVARGADPRVMDEKGNDAFDYAKLHDCPAAATIESLRQSHLLHASTPTVPSGSKKRL